MSRSRRQRLVSSGCRLLVISCLLILPMASFHPALPGTAWAQDAPPSEAIPAVLASIERAWSTGNADAIVRRLGVRKVLLRLPDNSQASRRVSHQQSLLILRDHFRTNEIRHFGFVQTQIPETASGRAIGLAEVTWRRHGVGRTKQGRVLMVLEREGERWVLTEVLALP